jgi:hypothetical protein
MPDSPTSEPESGFTCECEEQMRSACAGEPFYKEHEGMAYCVLHYPGKEKSSDFGKALQRKLEDKEFNFCGVWFPNSPMFSEFDFGTAADFRYSIFSAGADFRSTTFSAAADFRYATFTLAADFSFATFRAVADFNFATFGTDSDFKLVTFNAPAHFGNTTFSAAAYFGHATFSAVAYFRYATFGAMADFDSVTFTQAAYFGYATFAEHIRFTGTEKHNLFSDTSSLDLQFATIEKPDRVSFHTLSLRPYWFVNVNARKFDFTNVEWDWHAISEEIGSMQKSHVPSPHRLLAIACRHLAVNAEENHRYEEASKFRYMSMDSRRVESLRGFAPWRLSWWYWLASGYGERVLRAFLVLLGVWLVASLLYTRVGFARSEPKMASDSDVVAAKRDDVGAPLKFSRSLTYSAAVMTLQKPEPRPATTAAQAVVLFETILGPVQAALLALAIRRKFMR